MDNFETDQNNYINFQIGLLRTAQSRYNYKFILKKNKSKARSALDCKLVFPLIELMHALIDVFPILFDLRGLRPDMLRFPRFFAITLGI